MTLQADRHNLQVSITGQTLVLSVANQPTIEIDLTNTDLIWMIEKAYNKYTKVGIPAMIEPEDPRDVALDRLREAIAEPVRTSLDAFDIVEQVALILDLLDFPTEDGL